MSTDKKGTELNEKTENGYAEEKLEMTELPDEQLDAVSGGGSAFDMGGHTAKKTIHERIIF